MRPGQLLVDIGCGDGPVIRKACKRYGVIVIGYRLEPPWPGWLAWQLVADEQTDGKQ
jgi:cyclopropane fatty-acyl-phospholipid synthase-like methyltransferase